MMIADALHKLTTGSLIALTLYYTAFMGSRGVDIVQGAHVDEDYSFQHVHLFPPSKKPTSPISPPFFYFPLRGEW